MTIVKKYKRYRKIFIKLNNKIIDTCLETDAFLKSARVLGIAYGDTLMFENKGEMDILMDFALNEYRVNNKNTIEIYREKIGWQNKIEKEILDALASSSRICFIIFGYAQNSGRDNSGEEMLKI